MAAALQRALPTFSSRYRRDRENNAQKNVGACDMKEFSWLWVLFLFLITPRKTMVPRVRELSLSRSDPNAGGQRHNPALG